LCVQEGAPHIQRLAKPCPQPQRCLVPFVDRAGVDEVLDLPEADARLDLAIDRVPIVPNRYGPTCNRHGMPRSSLMGEKNRGVIRDPHDPPWIRPRAPSVALLKPSLRRASEG